MSPTTTRNEGENSNEYCRLKAATLAREGRQVFMADIFTFQAGDAECPDV
ncbi:MAG: hypothetical protein KJ687_08465 [Proteobacteria bacterium]|nr:hypothetical protein [Pseudomonadota bacterium]